MVTKDELAGLDGVLNEGSLRAVHVHEERRLAQVWIECLTVTPSGDEPEDPLLCIRLNGVTRVAASLRNAHWDDAGAPPISFELSELSDIVHSFNGSPIYGWEFFNPPTQRWEYWRNRLSLDVTFQGSGGSHVLELFQEQGIERHLDLRLWFEDLWITQRDSPAVPIDEMTAASRRWWDAMRAGDPRVQGHGIVPAGNWKPPRAKRRWFVR